MQPCNLLKPLPQSSRYSKNVYQWMHNEKYNKSSFYLPLLFNFYLLSYAFLLAKKKNVKGKNMKKSIDKWLSWSVLSGVVATMFFHLFFILFLALWMGGAFLIRGEIFIERRGEVWCGWNIHWKERRGVAWMEPGHLISWSPAPFSWSRCTCVALRAVFPQNLLY